MSSRNPQTPAASTLARIGGQAAILGGILWALYYVVFVSASIASGEGFYEQTTNLSAWQIVSGMCFMGGIVGFDIAILSLRARLDGRSRKFGIASAIFVGIALIVVSIGFALTFGITGETRAGGLFAGIGVVLTCIAATLIGIAVRRNDLLPGKSRNWVLIVGAATFPAIIAFTPLGMVVPDYITAEIPFALSGLAWIAIGSVMRASSVSQPRRQERELTATA
ncbi:MAG: hypothetical protein M3439_04015 [Chloroflexota bacterium]|nr:hypothetical protein [Chloroflexota bacterium]